MKILISGPSGLIGRELRKTLDARGHTTIGLSRDPRDARDIAWSPERGEIAGSLDGFDAVIHLAGESVAGGRWTAARKQRIRDSRVKGTELLASRAAAATGPRLFISASAIGFYGDQGDLPLTEESDPGRGFLPRIAHEWEGATEPAYAAGMRVVQLRIGLVLSPAGGALKAILLPFRLGAGGRLGPGTQWMSWIALPDVIQAIDHVIEHETIRGPVNLTAPHPVTNGDFTRTLAAVLGRPAILPVPAFALKLALGGQMATEMLLASTRVLPAVLRKTGYRFLHPELEPALRVLLGKSSG